MKEVSWFSQPFPPEGASLAEGIRNQLGRPELDLLTILVRESAQNSWDARVRTRTEPVDYSIDIWTVGAAHVAAWRDLLRRGAPLNDHLPLHRSLSRPTIRAMAISDRGTRGLGGPTRADNAVTKDHDFVSFVRNIGEPRDAQLGGGTYGFGKGIFYLVSNPGTILLHTRCEVDGRYETRLMGSALWKSYVANEPEGEKRYTGRHWWGDTSGDVVEPLVGAEAEAMAHRLGLTPFAEDETGTTIIMVDPNLDGLEPTEAAEYLAETITWHLWPKMLEASDGRPAMRFSVSSAGIDHPVPDPRETRPLNLFVAAYEKMAGRDGKDLECYRPKRFLGRLGLVKRTAPALEPTRASRMLGIETLVHHVCLMRPAELVVAYRPGPKPPSEFQSYAGVFRADTTMDETYAKAEPPTHDAWHPQSLEYPESTYINTTFRRIDDALTGLLDLGGGARAGSAKVALGAASTMFSSLVGGSWGMGGATDYKPGSTRTLSSEPMPTTPAGGPDDPSSGSHTPGSLGMAGQDTGRGDLGQPRRETPSGAGDDSPRRRPRVEYVQDPYYDERSGISVVIQEFRLPVAGSQRVTIDLSVALSGHSGRETDPPVGAAMPDLIGWEAPSGALVNAPTCIIEGGDDSVWHAVVRPAPDTMTEIEILTESVQPS
jgi:hypothetical protein